MSNTLTQNVLPPPWITKPQSSTGLNWGSETMLFYSCLLLLDRCNRTFEGRSFLNLTSNLKVNAILEEESFAPGCETLLL